MGDGGMVVTNDEDIYKKLLMLRDYGRVSKYEHETIGYNSRLDTLQAAILRIKLKKLDTWNQMRIKAAGAYDKLFKNIDGIICPHVSQDVKHVYHVYAIRSKNREKIAEKFKTNGVGAVIHYPIPLHLQKAYASLGYRQGDFPVAEKVCREIISLPMFPHIKLNQMKYIVKLIKNTF